MQSEQNGEFIDEVNEPWAAQANNHTDNRNGLI